ncbi:ABC-2 transporter permease [Clostridium minihomine]|uniref:ABC-2 transporter permease n=1 Tax=Clostridium minihomine TaxID=2045012 RepID=UPI000C75823F|nr:ABC-2 transporter permease [Clostridium minihomine]
MKGLFYKDVKNSRWALLITTLLLIIDTLMCPFFINFVAMNGLFITKWIYWFLFLLVYTSFQHDEASKWNLYALSLPVTKKMLVQSKYILFTLILFVFNIFAILVSYGFGNLTFDIAWAHLMLIALSMLIIGLFIPMIYRLGTQKAFLFLILLILLANGVCFVFEENRFYLIYKNSINVVFCLLSLFSYYYSYRFSCQLMEQKDF